ncbi:MAG: nucleoside-triphosphatase [Chloroflexota bacterium]
MEQILILTGARRVGKTTVCSKAVRLAKKQDLTCGGLLTLAEHGGRDVVDVKSERQRRLTQCPDATHRIVQGRFCFDPDTLRWGNRVLARATPCDLLVIDEIGPLELARNQGWTSYRYVLKAGRFALALVVVRSELVTRMCVSLQDCKPRVVIVKPDNRNLLPATVIRQLKREL